MSLLMDALKRAEAAKQQAGRTDGPSATSATATAQTPPAPSNSPQREISGLTLEPFGSEGGERITPLPDLASHLDAVDADLEATASMARPEPKLATSTQTSPPAFIAADRGRETARALFAAKPPPPPSRAGLWLILAALGLCGLGIAVYFWLQLSGMNRNNLGRPANAAIVVERTPPPQALPETMATPVPTPNADPQEPKPSATETEPAPPNATVVSTSAAPTRRSAEREPAAAADEAPNAEGLLQLSRTRPTADPIILRAWRKLQTGALEAARQDYVLGLRNDPKNVDALLGLAVIAQRLGRPDEAEGFYQQALEADPKDAAAQAAVIGLNAQSDPAGAESRLKTALSTQPDSASLHFALGNLYARDQRWNEAQQSYFNAVSGDTSNPDYLVNLAISLDRLRQAKLAAQYYQKALDAADKRPPAFDRERIRQRLKQLSAP